MDTIKQWAFAAWTYVENGAFTILEVDGAPAFDTLSQLQAASLTYFVAPELQERLLAGSFGGLKTSSEIYIVNKDGNPIYQDQNINQTTRHSTRRVFVRNSEHLTEITTPESGAVFSHDYDSKTGRALAETAKSGIILFDIATGERIFLPIFDESVPSRNSYRLVPGAPYIVATIRPLSRTVDPWLELWTNDGDRLMTIPTGTGMRVDIVSVQVSPAILAVALKETATGTHGDEERHFLRIFAAEK